MLAIEEGLLKYLENKMKKKTFQAITLFGNKYLQQAFVLLKSCYMTKFSYLSRVTPPHIFEPFTQSITNDVRVCVRSMLGYSSSDEQWGQCLLKPRHGGLGIMNLQATSKGAYLASLLACLPNIDSVSVHQHLELIVLQFDQLGQQNSLGGTIMDLYNHAKELHSNATKYDWRLSSWVLSKLPSVDQRTPGHITPTGKAEFVQSMQELLSIYCQLRHSLVDPPNYRLYYQIQHQRSPKLIY